MMKTGSGCLQWESITSVERTGFRTGNIIPAVRQWRLWIGDMLDIGIAEKAAEETGYAWDSSLYL